MMAEALTFVYKFTISTLTFLNPISSSAAAAACGVSPPFQLTTKKTLQNIFTFTNRQNMRASAALLHSSPVTKSATSETAAAKETFSPPVTLQQSRWHSPVPYLFGGLVAVLGLIVFALLILACSYWKLGGERNHVEGGKGDGGLDMKASPPFEEKILVIMAGDVRPTFLATPASSHEKLIHHVKDKENENNIDERIPVEIQLNREHVQI